MKKPYLKSNSFVTKLSFILLVVLSIIVIHSCRKDLKTSESSSVQVLTKNKINLAMLQKNYNKGIAKTKLKATDISQQTLANIINSLTVDWTSYTISTYPDSTQVVEFAMPDDTTLLSPNMPAIGDSLKYHSKTAAVFILRGDTVNTSFFMKTVEDGTAPGYQSVISYLHYQQIPGSFTGNIYYFTLNRDFLNGWAWLNGTLTSTVTLGNIVAQANNNINHLRPSEAEPCVETTYTYYFYQTDGKGNITYEEDEFSITEITCPTDDSTTPPSSTTTSGGASGASPVPPKTPCNPTSTPSSINVAKGRVVDVASGGGGTGTGSSGGSSNPCTTVKTVSPVDPCKQSAQISLAAANAVIAKQNASILSQTMSGGIEYGANQNLTAWLGNTYVNTAITPGTTTTWTTNFTWDATNGYTIGYSHGHPGDDGPSPLDVYNVVSPVGQSQVLRQNNAAQQYYESNAYVNTETSTGSYIVTISNWPDIIAILQSSYSTPGEQSTMDIDYSQLSNEFLSNNVGASLGDAGAYALLQLFPGDINIYYAKPNSTVYAPEAAGNKTLAPVPCPTN